eukprot:6095369-Lingulodinium_polyedra.AAC.1
MRYTRRQVRGPADRSISAEDGGPALPTLPRALRAGGPRRYLRPGCVRYQGLRAIGRAQAL